MQASISSGGWSIALGGLALAIGVFASYAGYKRIRRAREVYTATETTVAEVAADPSAWVGERVLLTGTARSLVERELVARVAERRALVATTVTERYESANRKQLRRSGWRRHELMVDYVPFALEADGETMEVEPPTDIDDFSSADRFETAFDLDSVTAVGSWPEGDEGFVDVVDANQATGFAGDGGEKADSQPVAADGGNTRTRQATLSDGQEVSVVATVTERFGHVFVTGEASPDQFRLVADGPPKMTRPALVGIAAILTAIASVAGAAWVLAPLVL